MSRSPLQVDENHALHTADDAVAARVISHSFNRLVITIVGRQRPLRYMDQDVIRVEPAFPWPALVGVIRSAPNGWVRVRIFALRANSSVHSETPLFHAPLMDLMPTGRLFESISDESLDLLEPESLQGWARFITGRVYHEVLNPFCFDLPDLSPTSLDYTELVRRAVASTGSRFPKGWLVSTGLRFGDLNG